MRLHLPPTTGMVRCCSLDGPPGPSGSACFLRFAGASRSARRRLPAIAWTVSKPHQGEGGGMVVVLGVGRLRR